MVQMSISCMLVATIQVLNLLEFLGFVLFFQNLGLYVKARVIRKYAKYY